MDDLLWKRKLLDCSIRSVTTNSNLELKGIITPTRLNKDKLKEYKSIPVQNVDTTVNKEHPDFPRCNGITRRIESHSDYCTGEEALHWPRNTKLRSRLYFDDNEHAILFMKMNVETPCLVIDGDCIIEKFRLNTLEQSMVLGGAACFVYIHKKEDAGKLLLNISKAREAGHKYLLDSKWIRYTHLYGPLISRFKECGLELAFNALADGEE